MESGVYKFVAVIPARAGSKGVPNKNIRMLNGKPLIAYAIDNAMKSEFIDKVIVSSDSEKVLAVARHMNADCINRDASLCGDSVTLDGVIHNAVENVECEYVVTMQPTSPTLTYKTLDKAIKYMIDNDYDTVISCVNSPRLAWKLNDNNELVPAYEKRLNRQYMPPEYVETGAFFITKREFVTPQSRLGKKIGVFEIPGGEAIDIDDFNDMVLVDTIMKRKKIAFYTKGNSVVGTGHIRRVLTLADEFDSKPDIYYNSTITEAKIFGDSTHNIMPVGSEEELLKAISDGNYDILINDILDSDVGYMEKVKAQNPNMKVINFDDVGDGAKLADGVINPFHSGEDAGKVKTGEKYFILNGIYRLFEPIKIKDEVKTVFICFGGADPADYTKTFAQILCDEKYKSINVNIVMGSSYRNAEYVKELCKDVEHINTYQNIDNIYDYMLCTDIAVSSRGITGYELGALGIPTMTLAENELEEIHTFLSDENGYRYIGREPAKEIIEAELDRLIGSEAALRQEMQNKLLKCDLKNGTKRVKEIIDLIGAE